MGGPTDGPLCTNRQIDRWADACRLSNKAEFPLVSMILDLHFDHDSLCAANCCCVTVFADNITRIEQRAGADRIHAAEHLEKDCHRLFHREHMVRNEARTGEAAQSCRDGGADASVI